MNIREQLAAVIETLQEALNNTDFDEIPTENPVELQESAVEVEFLPLVEKAIRRDGTIPLKLIEPGWGSSGYYSAEVLERDGPAAFTAGTKMYWDHPTMSEEIERPERSLRDLAAELTEDAYWDENGPDGPGLYANAKVFGPYREAVDELASHIGVSIRALGRAKQGEAEGRRGPIIEAITQAKSVDFVTEPGAGGKVLQLFEAARTSQQQRKQEETQEMEEKNEALREAQKLIEALRTEKARLQEALLLREAGEIVAGLLAEQELPEPTRKRLHKALSTNPPMTDDGQLDRAKLAERVEEAVTEELNYLREAAGFGGGRITGMGSAQAAEVDSEQVQARMTAAFQRLGLSEASAKAAATGRRM